MSIASTEGGTAGMESGGMPADYGETDYDSSDPAMAEDAFNAGIEADYAGTGPEDMHGADAGLGPADPDAEMRADYEAQHGAEAGLQPDPGSFDAEMRADYEAQRGAAGGAAPEDPAAMRAQFQQEAGAGVDSGAPGAPGEEGYGGGGRGSRAGQFEEGTAPYVVMQMVEAIDAGDLETAAKYISDDARGLLGSVRDGEAGENQVKELQSYFATMEPLSQRPRGRKITLNFNGGQSKVLSFDVVYEEREFHVESLTIHDAQTRRGR